jgi:hypothetical protein
MKKIFLASILALSTLVATAQEKTEKKHASPEDRAKKQTSKMDSKLSFNAKQKERVYNTNLSKNILIDNAYTTYANDKKAFQEEKKKINKERLAEVRKVFTKEQHVAWKELKKEKKEKKGGQKLSPSGGAAATDDELDEEVFSEFIKE